MGSPLDGQLMLYGWQAFTERWVFWGSHDSEQAMNKAMDKLRVKGYARFHVNKLDPARGVGVSWS